MKQLLKEIQREFKIYNPNTTLVEICTEIEYIKDTYVDEYIDLFTCLRFKN